MDDLLWVLLRGFVIGFSIAAPVGPIGMLCIRRSLSQGRWIGFLSGLGAATADSLYGSLAAFGITSLTAVLVDQQIWFKVVGGCFLLFLGARFFLSKPDEKATKLNQQGWLSAYASTFLLTLTNPLTILSFAAIITTLGTSTPNAGVTPSLVLVLGVFSGSAAWWWLLSALVSLVGGKLEPQKLGWINRLSGVVIAAFGVAALWGVWNSQERVISSTLITDQPVGSQASFPTVDASGFLKALPGLSLIFPDDNGPHPDFQTEWWYYTGNLAAADGRRFGYQLTFFRRALLPSEKRQSRESAWAAEQMYLAHFALTNVSADRHDAFERLERGAAGIAGAQADPFEVWLDEWHVLQVGSGRYTLHAAALLEGGDELQIDLDLVDIKGPVLQGDQGYSQKGPEPGNASYYYSLTRLESTGSITIQDRQVNVSGYSWMDHEFSTSALSSDQVGWDWFSIQMQDGSELMVFQLRQKDGTVDPYSSGTLINSDGSTTALQRDDFKIEVLDTWKSQSSGGIYPSHWRISVPSVDLIMELTPLIADQEMNLTYTYWEGAVRLRGSRGGLTLEGYGYVELTGYASSMAGEF